MPASCVKSLKAVKNGGHALQRCHEPTDARPTGMLEGMVYLVMQLPCPVPYSPLPYGGHDQSGDGIWQIQKKLPCLPSHLPPGSNAGCQHMWLACQAVHGIKAYISMPGQNVTYFTTDDLTRAHTALSYLWTRGAAQ